MLKEPSNEEYNAYVKAVTPKHSCLLNCLKAFLVGGVICTIGEVISQLLQKQAGLGIEDAGIEYQKEGQVFGIGVKVFTIAGPVILYGIFTSWVLGLIYWIWGMLR